MQNMHIMNVHLAIILGVLTCFDHRVYTKAYAYKCLIKHIMLKIARIGEMKLPEKGNAGGER